MYRKRDLQNGTEMYLVEHQYPVYTMAGNQTINMMIHNSLPPFIQLVKVYDFLAMQRAVYFS